VDSTHFIDAIRGGLVVSCQALPDEPFYSEDGGLMPRFAIAAERAGAVAIRANSARDVKQIKAAVDIPVIGLVKRDYPPFAPYITVTMEDVESLIGAGADAIAIDCTNRPRPDGKTPSQFVSQIQDKHNCALMADVATIDEGIAAAESGVDIVSTTLSGYTKETQDRPAPDFDLIGTLASRLQVPIAAEGRIHDPSQARKALELGAHCVVVGGAITRPLEIASRFVEAMSQTR
jgi:N-acylglucosamine-6-phosphate 2-epimerase